MTQILIMEEDGRFASTLGNWIERFIDYSALVIVSSFEDAEKRLDEYKFDLVISNLGVGKKGLAFLKLVGQRSPNTRRLLITSDISNAETKAHPYPEHPEVLVLGKPFSVYDFIKTIQIMLG